MRIILLIASILFLTPQISTALPLNDLAADKLVEINNISYNYEMFVSGNETPNCNGTLTLDLNFSENCTRILLFKSKAHILNDDKILSWAVSEYSIPLFTSKYEISLIDISWGTYFKIRADFEDGTYIYSPIYCTNSYIKKEDLDIILRQTSVVPADVDPIEISIKGKNLFINTSTSINFTVADLTGNLIFTGVVSQPTSIPIDKAKSMFIITRYKINGSIITKKFAIK
jgi:hypothetical protein